MLRGFDLSEGSLQSPSRPAQAVADRDHQGSSDGCFLFRDCSGVGSGDQCFVTSFLGLNGKIVITIAPNLVVKNNNHFIMFTDSVGPGCEVGTARMDFHIWASRGGPERLGYLKLPLT